ncbi:hypothetical protein [Absidia glauca]|uniref:Reverse transcriptase zinc-binding domain-containing protein n=1 Tax=Absidia glauca TaxID=4829 RepID=A0A168R9C4_ABSGL|nr:hypothetical protein [Absidia glauca]
MENFRQKRIRWSPLLESQTSAVTKKLSPSTTTSPSWTHHWRWQFAPDQNPIVYRCPLSWIRSQWQKDKQASRPMPKPPYAYPPADTMNAAQWKLFWTLRIPHNVRSVWWRTLHHRLSTRVYLHKIMPGKFESSCCPICLESHEDAIHLLVNCPRKLAVWRSTLEDAIQDPYHIWQTITFSTIPRSKKHQQEWTPTLTQYGRIL